MVFSSYIFILVFLPLTVLGYFLLSIPENRLYQKLFLLAASLFFYGYYTPKYVLLILVSILVNYLFARGIQWGKPEFRKLFFVLGILFNIFLIGYFKYFDFFIENINAVFSSDFNLRHIILPLGISFFTFQQLSFLISIYKKEEELGSILDYSLFVTFFPQLVAGPIVLYSEMIPQFKDESKRHFNTENLCRGIYIFAIGLFKKAVLADTLAHIVANGFSAHNLSLSAAWISSLSYTFQIYFDFSGYSDMATGIASMFNIKMPLNFMSPYRSESISVFWRRWHMTLGRALSTYVYKPLGGSRRGKLRTCLNLFLTFLVSGLWHGAAWTFVLWGALHGALAVIERLSGKFLEKIPKGIRIAFTFLTVNVLFVLFRAENFSQVSEMYRGMLNFANPGLSMIPSIVNDGLIGFPALIQIAYILGLLLFMFILVFFCKSSMQRLESFRFSRGSMLFTVLLCCFSLVCLSRESIFIYFNF